MLNIGGKNKYPINFVKTKDAYLLSFRNANAGDLYINQRGLGYRIIVHKSEGFGISENCT